MTTAVKMATALLRAPVQEESSVWLRMLLACIGGLNLRPLSLHWRRHPDRPTIDAYTVVKACRCGGALCCPLKMALYSPQRGYGNDLVGLVEEDWQPSAYCHG